MCIRDRNTILVRWRNQFPATTVRKTGGRGSLSGERVVRTAHRAGHILGVDAIAVGSDGVKALKGLGHGKLGVSLSDRGFGGRSVLGAFAKRIAVNFELCLGEVFETVLAGVPERV